MVDNVICYNIMQGTEWGPEWQQFLALGEEMSTDGTYIH